MHLVALIFAGVLMGDTHEYSRPLTAKKLDQATFGAEAFGETKKVKREDAGLHITLAPGEAETGWKTPQTVRFGGDFSIKATFVIRKLPKPALEDGAAIGLALAAQSLDQPDATLLRLIETNGSDVYRSIEKANNSQQQMMMMQPGMVMAMGMVMPPGGQPPKPPRKTFRAKGDRVVLELRREGQTLSYYVLDAESDAPRYLGQVQLGANDIAGVKLFASNRNGAEPVDVILHDLTIRADRINGLGTEVRSVFGEIVHGEPTAIEGGKLIVGGPPREPPASPSSPNAGKPGPEGPSASALGAVTAFAPVPAAPAPVAAAQPAPAPAPAAQPAPAPAPAGAVAVAIAPASPPAAAVKPNEGAMPKGAAAASPPASAPKAEPKAKLSLDEVDVIAFERASMMSGRSLGQPNLDFTMGRPPEEKDKDGKLKPAAKADDALAPPPGTAAATKIPKLEPKPNGICDLHLTLSGLRSAEIKQVMINGQTDKGPASWRLDTSDSNDSPLVLRRAGIESWADLFLEPPQGDLKGKDLTVNVTYGDGQNGNASIKVETSTDPKRAFDPKVPAPTLDARVHLTGGEQLFGKFEGLGEDALRLRTPWGDALAIPLAHVVGVYLGLPEHKESPESFARRLRTRGTDDLLLARSGDGEVVAISGIAEKTEGDKLHFHFQEKSRTLSLKQVEGLVLAARPEPERPGGLRPSFSMEGGLVISGLWKSLDTKTWKIETAWGQALDLPASEIRTVRFRGGRMTYLSDLEPSRVEETPFFGRRNPWRKDANLAGAPLKMDGQTFERGLAVHSRSVLTYDLNKRYTKFEALVGFDESARKLGRVDCRVFADDKELFANPDLRGDAPPVKLNLPVAGAERLKIVVDFGPGQDTGDRVIWANARLFREAPAGAGDVVKPKRSEPDTPKRGSGE